MEPVRIFSTRPDRQISKSSPVNRPVDRFLTGPVDRFFLQKVFVYCSMYLMKNFQKGVGGMGEVLKFVTLDEDLRKKSKKSLFFSKMT